MRQRTISDFFWRDPDISDLSQEDKATLLYFLTSPSSNIIGVYQVVWRIAAAEMGWTADQLMVVVRRLQTKGLVDFNGAGWIWVKPWWKHNSAAGAFSPKLFQNAKKQCTAMPGDWLDDFLKLLESVGVDRVSIGYGHPIDIPPPNTTCNSISICTTTTGSDIPEDDGTRFLFLGLGAIEIEGIKKDLDELPTHLAQDVIDELVALKRAGVIQTNVISLAHGLIKKAKAGRFNAAAGLRVRKDRERRLHAPSNSPEAIGATLTIDPAACEKGANLLPSGIRARYLQVAHSHATTKSAQ